MKFEEFIAELEAEATADGPEAVAELAVFRLHYSLCAGTNTVAWAFCDACCCGARAR